MRQWWELKAKNYDTILFFKVGKFYEFYHMDAVIAAQELGILYMRVSVCYLFIKSTDKVESWKTSECIN